MISLINNGMYAMTDIAEIDIPRSIEDLVAFASNLQASLAVSKAFKVCCNGSTENMMPAKARKEFTRATLSTPKFDSLIDKNNNQW
jgi:hypothetical protein